MTELLNMLILFAPLLLVMALANLSERQRLREEPHQAFAITSYLVMTLLYGIGIMVGLVLQTLGPQLFETAGLPVRPASFDLLGGGIWIPSLVGILFLLPPIRRLVASFTSIDPRSPVHAIALAFTMLVLINLMFTLGFGLANLAEVLADQAEAGQNATSLLGLWLQQIFTALLGMIGVGWLIRRDWPSTLQRLGLVMPTTNQAIIGVVFGLLMVPVIMGVEQLGAQFNFGFDPTVEDLTEQLLGPLFESPFGIFTIGAAAALGEETIFRGALQPRFGILLTSLLFALVHSNYGFTLSTLIVFVIGLLLGVLRKRYNTSTAMLMHATYNMALALLAYLGI